MANEQNIMFVMLTWVGVFLVDLLKKIIPHWEVLGSFFVVVVETRVPKNVGIWVMRILLLVLYLTACRIRLTLQIGVNMSGKQKMISLFKKIVLLAKKNFLFLIWLHKTKYFKVVLHQKKIFYEYFSKRKICTNVFAADEWLLNEHVCHNERKFEGGCILSVLWVRKLFLPLFFFSFVCPVVRKWGGGEFRVVPFFLLRYSEGLSNIASSSLI